MALSATIYKAELNISDMDRQYYASHALTIAQHPSENDARMMLRLLCFALYADEQLNFTKGISTDDEPDLWLKNLSDEIELWIELGQPDEKRIRKACGRAQQVVVVNYGGHAEPWWKQNAAGLDRYKNLRVFKIDDEALNSLSALAQRNMELQATIQDGEVYLTSAQGHYTVALIER